MFFLLDTAEDSNRRMLNVLRPERKRLRVHVRDGNWFVRWIITRTGALKQGTIWPFEKDSHTKLVQKLCLLFTSKPQRIQLTRWELKQIQLKEQQYLSNLIETEACECFEGSFFSIFILFSVNCLHCEMPWFFLSVNCHCACLSRISRHVVLAKRMLARKRRSKCKLIYTTLLYYNKYEQPWTLKRTPGTALTVSHHSPPWGEMK